MGRIAILSALCLRFVFSGRGAFSLGRVWSGVNAMACRGLADVEGEGRFIGLVELSGTTERERGAALKAPMSGRDCV